MRADQLEVGRVLGRASVRASRRAGRFGGSRRVGSRRRRENHSEDGQNAHGERRGRCKEDGAEGGGAKERA
jgi:hypothetical protein